MNDTFSVLKELRGRNKDLGQGNAYALSQDQFGMDVSFDQVELDEREMSVWVPFADGNRRDGVGDLLEVGGINTERHVRNPVCLFDHGKQYILPIGLAESPQGAYTVEIDPHARTARGKAYFYQGTSEQGNAIKDLVVAGQKEAGDHALFCEQLFDLMAKKFVRAGSIGYQVIHAKHLMPDPERGTPGGLHLLQVLMLEFSVVVMPANMDTVRKALAMPSCGKPLHKCLIKSLTPYAGPKKVQMGYERRKGVPTLGGGEQDAYKRGKEAGRQGKPRSSNPYSDPSYSRQWQRGYADGQAGKKHKASPRTVNVTNFKPGEKVVARSYLSWTNPVTGKVENFAKTGDRMTVLEVEPSGLIRVARPDGASYRFSSNDVRRVKSMGEKAIRVTYRNKVVKGFAEVECKFDTSGMTIEKQNAFVKDMDASGFGLPSQGRFSSKSPPTLSYPMKAATFRFDIDPGAMGKGMEDGDAVADALKSMTSIARKHGAKYLGNQAKTLLNQRTKAMPEDMSQEDMPQDDMPQDDMPQDDDLDLNEDDIEITDDSDMDDQMGADEPYGAQIIRHSHGKLMQDIKDYHDMLSPLEHQGVKGHMEGYLGEMEKWLTKKEDLFSKEYGHLPGLTGMKDGEGMGDEEPLDEEAKDMDTMDDDAVSADSGTMAERDEVEPEEAAEAMSAKAIRRFYRNKALGRKTCLCGKSGKAPCACARKGRKDLTGDEADQIEGELGQGKDNPDDDEKALEPHEHGAVQEASGFAKELATPESQLDDEGRMKAYHYYKTLDGIANVKAMADEAAQEKPTGPPPGVPMEQGKHLRRKAMSDDVPTPKDGMEPMNKMSCRKACGQAGQFFKVMSACKDFGDPHRSQAAAVAKALDDALSEAQDPTAEGPTGQEVATEPPEDDFTPGVMGEKALTNALKLSLMQGQELALMQKRLSAIRL